MSFGASQERQGALPRSWEDRSLNGDHVPRGITIGATHYPTKEAVRNVCRGIVQRYGIGGDVTDPDDDAFLRHLLERHPEYDLKRGSGIAHFRVMAHTEHGRKSVGLGSFVWITGQTRGRCPRCGVRPGRWWRSSRSGWRCRATASGG
ncbi:DUF3223 domain-containing protein [Streptomyces sp. NPDC001034]|uniref:DUF3223 domain-containing protein n=1 Tax=Streptomyces sp. NPDC001034 TaxID=3154375 RepID=UPI00331926C3